MSVNGDLTWEERVEAQTAALASFGFGPAFSVGGGGPFYVATHFTTCQRCGAAVAIDGDPEAEQPVALHKAWHEGVGVRR